MFCSIAGFSLILFNENYGSYLCITYCVRKKTRIRNHFLEDFILRTRSKNVTYNVVTAVIKVKKKKLTITEKREVRKNFIEMV